MHVGRRKRDVAERWRFEPGRPCRGDAGVVKWRGRRWPALPISGIGEVETAMAAEAADIAQPEEHFAAFGGIGNGVLLAAPMIPVIRRAEGDDCALEASQRFANVSGYERIGLAREGGGKQPAIHRSEEHTSELQ